MPEVQKADSQTGETAQRFIEFIMMQAQQAMLFLGRLPHPSTGETIVNLEAARMFIDYIEMLKEKTRGNLSSDEEKVLGSILSDLQMSFVQVSNDNPENKAISNPEPSSQADSIIEEKISSEEDQKKRFSKSYGEL
ncbi:MAG: DUF1844 domain-containing protein [Chthoniobacterales bacterium]|nr:DUF1844 domain-containing protein [Chthoniobacterales bacterium]